MQEPKDVTVGEFREHQADFLNQVRFGNEAIRINKHGKGMGVVISVEQYEKYVKAFEEREDEIDVKNARKALEEVCREGAESWEDVKRDLDIDV